MKDNKLSSLCNREEYLIELLTELNDELEGVRARIKISRTKIVSSSYTAETMDNAFVDYPIMGKYRDVDEVQYLLDLPIKRIYELIETKEYELTNMIVDELKKRGII